MSESANLKEKMAYHPLLLGIMAMVAGMLLVQANMQTKGDILKRQQEDLQASISQVITADMHDNQLLDDTLVLHDPLQYSDAESGITFYRARIKGQVTAVAFSVIGMGYSGAIYLMMGVDQNGEILAVRVIAHAETPGLGDKIEVEKDQWINSFSGQSLDNRDTSAWAVKKDGGDFDQFSGATITPRAVVKAVHQGLKYFNEHREVILDLKPSPVSNTKEDDHG